MRKLNIDALRVESFTAGEEAPARGTVRGHGTGMQMCNPFGGNGDTREESCYGTCPQPCGETLDERC
jgi:hypothetical protein